MKRILSIFLALVFAISLVGFASAADDQMATPAPVKKHHKQHKKAAPAPEATPAPAPETK